MDEAFGVFMFVGIVITGFVLHHRAGFSRAGADWREFLLRNPHWFVLMLVKMFFWPVTLVAWLVTGMGPSRWTAITQENGRRVRKIVRVEG